MSLEYSKQLNFMKNAYKKLRNEYDKINMIAVTQQDEISQLKFQIESQKKQKELEKKKIERLVEIEKELGLESFIYNDDNYFPNKKEILKIENLNQIFEKEEIDLFLMYDRNIFEINKKINELNKEFENNNENNENNIVENNNNIDENFNKKLIFNCYLYYSNDVKLFISHLKTFEKGLTFPKGL
jgi:hypothetical protein